MQQIPLAPGTPAPDFKLRSSPHDTISLRGLRGRSVVVAFYPADWNPICGDQLRGLQDFLPDIRGLGAELLAISVDGVWSHQAFSRWCTLEFPLLSDFQPRGSVARAYQVFDEEQGIAGRALFVIDQRGIIIWSSRYPAGVNPGVHGLLTVLETLPARPDVLSDLPTERRGGE